MYDSVERENLRIKRLDKYRNKSLRDRDGINYGTVRGETWS